MENFEGKVITVKIANDTFDTYVYDHLSIEEDETVIEIDNANYGFYIHIFSFELIKVWNELDTIIYKLSNNINR
jgi:hypothetical protein